MLHYVTTTGEFNLHPMFDSCNPKLKDTLIYWRILSLPHMAKNQFSNASRAYAYLSASIYSELLYVFDLQVYNRYIEDIEESVIGTTFFLILQKRKTLPDFQMVLMRKLAYGEVISPHQRQEPYVMLPSDHYQEVEMVSSALFGGMELRGGGVPLVCAPFIFAETEETSFICAKIDKIPLNVCVRHLGTATFPH